MPEAALADLTGNSRYGLRHFAKAPGADDALALLV